VGSASAKSFPGSLGQTRVVVRHRDLDLSDAKDVAIVEQRLRIAVREARPAMTRSLSNVPQLFSR
jgi:UrcA family protein